MSRERVIKAKAEHYITDGFDYHFFPTDYDKRIAQFFLDKGANLLYSIAVDYPGLYKIPLYLREAAKDELKCLGFKTYRPKSKWTWDGKRAHYEEDPPYAMLYYLGPRPNSSYYGTPSYLATSFKIYLYGFEKMEAK
jgi:hypothetical protein